MQYLKRFFNKILLSVILLSYILILLFFVACVEQPSNDKDPTIEKSKIALILCEGLWHYNNSVLSAYDFSSGKVVRDFYESSNPGMILGDIANHIVLKGDTAYIAMTTGRTIEIINIKTGKSLGRITLEGNRAPRRIAIIDDSLAVVSDLYDHSITAFNPSTFQIVKEKIATGPAPEGVASWGNYIFVANSGYGDYLADQPKAGTVSVMDKHSFNEVKLLDTMPDVIELTVARQKGWLAAVYYNLPSLKDSLGGIKIFDCNTLKELFHFRIDAQKLTFSLSEDTIFFITDAGVSMIDLTSANHTPQLMISKTNSDDFWYTVAVCPFDNTIWIGNARNYTINGEVLVYDLRSPIAPQKRIDVGVNPNNIIFYLSQ